MKVKKFVFEKDYEKVKKFLSDRYKETKNITCWLPQRFDDLIFRIDTVRGKQKKLAFQDFVFIWEEKKEIVALLIPDGESCYPNIKPGYEYLFPEMVDVAEKELNPLFTKQKNGKINFVMTIHLNSEYMIRELLKRGYKKDYDNEDYDNYQLPFYTDYTVKVPPYFEHVYGEDLDENMKAKACHFGIHPEEDDGDLTGIFKEGTLSYQSRKRSSFYKDSFESLIITKDGDICAYSFCYVDKDTSTAYIEPVCTRRIYRHVGLGKAMLHGIINRLKEAGIEKCYVNSYGAGRHNFYAVSGFITDNTSGYWHKEI